MAHQATASKEKEVAEYRDELLTKLNEKSNEINILEHEISKLIEEN